MYNQIYNTTVKITEGQKKKHFSMFTSEEKIYLSQKIDIAKKYTILSEHHEAKNNGITLTDINKILTSGKYSIVEYNETTKNNITDYRILIRSTEDFYTKFYDTKLNYSYNCECNLCFVISIKTGKIITSYFNKSNDIHTTINFLRYDNLQIIK